MGLNTDTYVTATTDPLTGGIESLVAGGYPVNNDSLNAFSALPNFLNAITGYNDATGGTIRIIGLGSSVGNGATLPDTATQSPVAKFSEYVRAALNQLSNVTITTTNGSVDGTTITSGVNTDYAAAKVTAGGVPSLAVLIYGMNDGAQAQYHAGQTYTGCATALINLIKQIRGDGGDVVLTTTPHPHSTRTPWTTYTAPITYPASNNQLPAPTYSASVVTGDWLGNGRPVPASYRHKRTNELIRRVAADTGCVLIDVERYWFEAVARFGEDALFNTGEYVHPNLLGHQASYWAAFKDFARTLKSGKSNQAVVAVKSQEITAYKVGNSAYTTTTLTDDAQLAFYIGPSQVFEFEADIFYTAPVGADMQIGFSLPSGAAGRFAVCGVGTGATGFQSDTSTFRSAALTSAIQVGGNGADAGARVRGIVVGGSVGGNVTMQFRQDVASGTTTVYQYSAIKAKLIA